MMKSRISGYTVKPRQYGTRIAAAAVAGAALVLLMALSTDEGYWSGVYKRIIGADLYDHNVELQEKVLMLEQTALMDRQAAALLQEELKNSQEEIYQLKKDLIFYQGIMNTAGETNGPDVHSIRVQPLTQERSYRLELILIHVAKTDKMTEGKLGVVLEGIQDTAARRLGLSEVTLDKNTAYNFRFKSFQRFENNFILPENFRPQRILVNLSIKNGQKSGFEKIFDWPVTTDWEGTDVG